MREMLGGEEIGKYLKNLVYEKTQIKPESVDLTVKTISRIVTTSSIDFGGSEYVPGERIELAPRKIDPAEKYGWWFLAEGEFLVEYNETLSLPPDHLGIIQPHIRLIEAGATHDTRFITESEEKLISLLRICQADARIKENARISKLIVLRHK